MNGAGSGTSSSMTYCCKYFKETVEVSKIIKNKENWWINLGDKSEVIIDYCPFCGSNIGNNYNEFDND